MKTIRNMLLLLILFAPVALGQDVTVSKVDKNRMELTLTAHQVLSVGAAQQLLLPRAEQECGNSKLTFGRYHFTGDESLSGRSTSKATTSFQFVQEITCGVTKPESSHKESIGILQKDSSQDLKGLIRSISLRFLRDRSSGAFRTAYTDLSTQMRSFSSYGEWSKKARKFNKLSGAIASATVWRVTVYKDPVNAPMPGIYIAADYEVTYKNVPLQCGYLMWYELPQQRFAILREESGTVSSKMMGSMSIEQLTQVKTQFGCAR